MIDARTRRQHLRWALQLTSIPTAAAREHRVINWINDWLGDRPNLTLRRDKAGNMLISRKGARRGGRPLLITAHLDHPAFVIKKVRDSRTLQAEFRGGVRPPYFRKAKVLVYDASDAAHRGTVIEHGKGKLFDEVVIRLNEATDAVQVDDLATWDLKPARVRKGLIEAPACDDLMGVAAALSAMDVLRQSRGAGDVRVLLTRSEEIGFIGAIAASQSGLIPRRAKVIALENSRSFADSPIGGGPILRVGDRISIFHHGLAFETARVAMEMEKRRGGFKWQRRLMPGGACEATTFQAYGYEAICLCLPLGNYHNMANLAEVIEGKKGAKALIAAEFVSQADYHGLVDWLVECGRVLTGPARRGRTDADGAAAIRQMMEKIERTKGYVLREGAALI
ncbi:MAG: M20/M25/M40 family metallo-hydrolase [Phycisphaerales bacterium]|nr:M20/M25/M40 family metallo-hydrolase [Phycisphaerales bacterium]